MADHEAYTSFCATGDRPPVNPRNVDLRDRATVMHGEARRRRRHFTLSILADDAMAVMLSLFVAEIDGLSVSEASVLLANAVPAIHGGAMIDDLVQAGLVAATGEMPGQRSVGLTPLGSARMRSFVGDKIA